MEEEELRWERERERGREEGAGVVGGGGWVGGRIRINLSLMHSDCTSFGTCNDMWTALSYS